MLLNKIIYDYINLSHGNKLLLKHSKLKMDFLKTFVVHFARFIYW